jgi:hypothetical protein
MKEYIAYLKMGYASAIPAVVIFVLLYGVVEVCGIESYMEYLKEYPGDSIRIILLSIRDIRL